MGTIASIETLGNAARTAMLAGDWATALSYAHAAQMELATTPDSEFINATGFKFDRRAIESMIANICRQQAVSLGMQQTKITYARPTDS